MNIHCHPESRSLLPKPAMSAPLMGPPTMNDAGFPSSTTAMTRLCMAEGYQ